MKECLNNQTGGKAGGIINPKYHFCNFIIHLNFNFNECPSEIINQIGGWTMESVGEAYGEGHSLKLRFKWMIKLQK